MQLFTPHVKQLSSLPESFGQLTALHGQGLPPNQPNSALESFDKLPALQRWMLCIRHLSNMPDCFGQFIVLTGLELPKSL